MTWPNHLLPAIEAILEAHYNQRDNRAYQGKSSTAAVADKCYQSGWTLKGKCNSPGCQSGFLGTGERCRGCNGTGFKIQRVAKVHQQTRACPDCGGCGQKIPKDKDAREDLLGRVQLKYVPKCENCDGDGYVLNYDCHPHAAPVFGVPKSDSIGLEDDNLELVVCLDRLQKNDTHAEECLLWLYGNAGCSVESTQLGERYGRTIVLWQFTDYGKRIIETERKTKPNLRVDMAILEAAKRTDGVTIGLVDNAAIHAQALKMRALSKFWTADFQTGGWIRRQAEGWK